MKRISTAAVAAAMSISLVAVPAMAQENTGSSVQAADDTKVASSKTTDEEAIAYYNQRKAESTKLLQSITKDKTGEAEAKAVAPLASSFKSDKAQDWAPGKTFEILLGTGIAAAVLGIVAFLSGAVKLPF